MSDNWSLRKIPQLNIYTYTCNYCNLKIEQKYPLNTSNMLKLTIHSDMCYLKHKRIIDEREYQQQQDLERRDREWKEGIDAFGKLMESPNCIIS